MIGFYKCKQTNQIFCKKTTIQNNSKDGIRKSFSKTQIKKQNKIQEFIQKKKNAKNLILNFRSFQKKNPPQKEEKFMACTAALWTKKTESLHRLRFQAYYAAHDFKWRGAKVQAS